MSGHPREFTFSTTDPQAQAALEARRVRVLALSNRLPTWAEDAQYVGGYHDARRETNRALQELAERGVRFDMTPTMMGGDETAMYAQWQAYLERVDTAWRDAVRAIIGRYPDTPVS